MPLRIDIINTDMRDREKTRHRSPQIIIDSS
jgi:hypothetical protein